MISLSSKRPFTIGLLALLGLLAGACGSSDDGGMDQIEGPLPTGVDDATAYTEGFLALNPLAQVQLKHLVVLQLEPAGSGAPLDTCSERDGVDCIPYFFEVETPLALAIDEAAAYIDELVLVDEAGAVVARDAYGGEPAAVVVGPGSYVLEVHHAATGDPDAATYTTFVQAVLEGEGASAEPATVGPSVLTLVAQRDCVRCSFRKATLDTQNFDGLELTGSVFDGATIRQTTFRGAMMDNCSLREITGFGVVSSTVRGSDQFDADFSGAVLTGSHFSFRESPPDVFVALFRQATLDATVWELEGADRNVCKNQVICSSVTPDFRNASLRGSQFSAVRLSSSTHHEWQCTFQGADLTGASFRAGSSDRRGSLSRCRFDREPDSGKVTDLHGADLGRVFADTNLSEADLTDAVLEGTLFNCRDRCALPANLSRADLSGARVAGAAFQGVDLSHATLTGIVPPTLNGFDLKGTNLAGVHLAGLDLSEADLSGAILFGGDPATFVGAKLTNGTQGVKLIGQKFPALFADFKDADLTGADLSKAELFEANLEGVTLNGAKLIGTNLNFANLRGAKLRGATLGVQPGTERAGASLRSAFMVDIDLSDADLRSVDLTGAHLYGDSSTTSLVRTRLDSANLSDTVCSGTHFSGTLNDAVFNRAQLVNTVFNGATLTNTKFDDTYLQGADFSNAISVRGVTLSNAAVSAEEGFWNFTEQDGAPFVVRYGATKLGALATDRTVRCPNGGLGPCCPTQDLKACLAEKLEPESNGPFPPVPTCVPTRPRYNNCITPMPNRTPAPP